MTAERLNAEIAAHPRSALIEALADAMHSIEDDDGNGRHISYYRSLAFATVEILPALFYDEDALCDEPGCGAHPLRSRATTAEGGTSKDSPTDVDQVVPAADLAMPLERGEDACLDHDAVWPDCAPLHEPVTPAADLADEAVHERVARAIHSVTWPGEEGDATWETPLARERAYQRAKAAIAAYRAGPSEHVGEGS